MIRFKINLNWLVLDVEFESEYVVLMFILLGILVVVTIPIVLSFWPGL